LARDRPDTQDASPAKLYATLIGAVLTIGGIVGFFYSASFGSPGHVGQALGLFSVNGWDNVVHILIGAIGLLVAGFAARRYALWLGIACLGIALWGFVLGSDELILGVFPVNTADNLLHLVLGLLGVGAALGTSDSTPRTKPTKGPSRPKARPEKPAPGAINA
jgi:hypothetical protein